MVDTVTIPDSPPVDITQNTPATVSVELPNTSAGTLEISPSSLVAPPPSGVNPFLSLTDVPGSYIGYAGYIVRVKLTEDGLEFIAGAGLGGGGLSNLPIEDVGTTAYTATLADIGKEKRFTNNADISFTIPPHSDVAFAKGDIIFARAYGDGQVTLVPGAGVVIKTSSTLRSREVNSIISIQNIDGADEWAADGDLEGLITYGDVVGPSSAVSTDIAVFDGVTGKILQDSGILLSDIALLSVLATVATSGDFSDLTGKPTTVAGYGITDAVGTARTIGTTAPLTGGGDLSANRTIAMPAATASADGYATATQITKLNGIAAGATANSSDATLLARANHTGTESADVLTDGTTNKAFLATERTKLSGIATGATANDTDANLKNRANHTGTQLASTISDFAPATAAIATMSGLSHGLEAAVVNTAVKTAAASILLAANALTGSKSVEITIGGLYLNNSGATKTINLELKLGATTLWQCTSGALTAGAGTHAFSASIKIDALNASNVQWMHGCMQLSSPLNATTGNGDISTAVTAAVGFNTSISGPSSAGAAEDGTTALTVVLNATHSAAASTVSFQVLHWSVEYKN